MIEALSDRISGYVYDHNDRKHVSREVMKFALVSLMTNGITVLLCLCIGLIDGKFKETCIALLAMAVLRNLTGGYHLRSPALCIAVSTAAVTIVPLIPLNTLAIYICAVVSMLLVWKYAPSDLKNKTRISSKTLIVMKYAGLLLVASNLFFISETLAVSFLIVSLTLLPFKGGELIEK